MYDLIYEYENNAVSLFTIPFLAVTNVTGLGMVKTNATYTQRAGMDGEELAVQLYEKRDIQITFRLTGGQNNNANARRYIYDLFSEKKIGKLRYIDNELNVYVNVNVESIEPVIWSNTPTMIISLVAPNPYWTTGEKAYIKENITGNFIFPLEVNNKFRFGIISKESNLNIQNNGQVRSPIHFVLTVNNGTLENPTIRHIESGEYIGFDKTFSKGDKIEVYTKKGGKEVFYTPTGGTKTDLFSSLSAGSEWIKMNKGYNQFILQAGNSDADASLSVFFEELYIGVE